MPKGKYDRKPIEERLLEACSRSVETGCLLYNGHIDRYGYGQISHNSKTRTCHKLMWELKNGEVPEGMEVCHSCDEKYTVDSKENRRCCEPSHLYLGTRKENAERMKQLGRAKGGAKPGDGVGEENGNCKMTDAKLLEFYNKSNGPLAYGGLKKLAKEYGISYPLAQKIRGGTYSRLLPLL
jgi:hypothetical protein